MSNFDIAQETELGQRAAAEANWEKAKATIPAHDAEFEADKLSQWVWDFAADLHSGRVTDAQRYHVEELLVTIRVAAAPPAEFPELAFGRITDAFRKLAAVPGPNNSRVAYRARQSGGSSVTS